MNTNTAPVRRFAAIVGATAITAITTVTAQPASAIQEPGSERPCFIVQPRWNTAIDGPPPTCPTPSWQQATAFDWGTPGSSAGTAPRRTDDFGV